VPGADSRSLCRTIRQRGKLDPIFVDSPERLPEVLAELLEEGDLVLTQGAGNIGALARQLAALRLDIKAMRALAPAG
jgi:UDP-N-acetylmuramate--alanine ligase